MFTAGKRGTKSVERCCTAMTIHTDKQSHEYILNGTNWHYGIKRHKTFVASAHSNDNPHCKRSDRCIVHGPNRQMFTAGKRDTTFVERWFTAMTIHTEKRPGRYTIHEPNGSMCTAGKRCTTSFMDITGQRV